MKVIVSCGGQFHAIHLANQLERLGILKKLIIPYYRRLNDKVNPSLITKILLPRLWTKAYFDYLKQKNNFGWYVGDVMLFSSLSRRFIDECDIFVGWSHFSLKPMRKAKELGAVTVIERGSSHISFQMKLLQQERELSGVTLDYGFDKWLDKIIELELQEYEEADFVCVPSLFVMRSFLEMNYPEEKIIHIPYGVNLNEFKRVKKIDNVFRIIHCGSLSVRKGVHYLLKAFYELNLPNSELWLIGTKTNEIVSYLRKYDNGRVFHKGPYSENELYKYYSQGSVFCLMSIEEGLAMVLAQAMACGLPVICTTNTGGEDVVEEGKEGFIIPIRDVQMLKDKIQRFYENPALCKEMGLNALNKSQQYTWDSYGDKIAGEYRCLLKK
jgi:glycosyltransferase involved in cell wall biosynthesis